MYNFSSIPKKLIHNNTVNALVIRKYHFGFLTVIVTIRVLFQTIQQPMIVIVWK